MIPTRLFDFLEFAKNNHPSDNVLNTKYNGKWQSLSTHDYDLKANYISSSLISMGVKPGDKIAMISSTNRSEWSIIDMGLSQIGAINVPLYPTITSKDYLYILNHSECKYCFVSDLEVYEKVFAVKEQVKSLKNIYSFDNIDKCSNWRELIDSGQESLDISIIQEQKSKVKPEDLATIIYTSGTTGTPKGVMLSHSNIVSNVLSTSNRFPFEKGKETALSFLPICHVFERVVLYSYLYNGIDVYFAESLETISDNLKEVKPEIMTAVPRLLEKVYDKIYSKGEELDGLKQKLFYWAVEIALKYEPYNNNGILYSIKLALAKKLILSKWQEALGGNLKLIASGSAPLQARLARVFTAAGMTIVEGYGLTETSPAISLNDMRNGGLKIGTVGKLVDGVEVKIAEDGEILCKGPNVMMGYYKEEEKTKEVMSGDFFHTGDIGIIDSDGFLKITDRKKEMFKTSGGKYIAPAVIEGEMKQSLFIEQIMVVGESKRMAAAIIQPNFEYIENWMKENNIQEKIGEIYRNDKLINEIQKDIDIHNEKFAQWEKIKKFELTSDPWTIENGLLTPTMKLKRKAIKSKYQHLINKIYT
ncbi:MAG: long-chain fatty acid--CoA ligase [Flavobacteriaceae bacterium]|nr:long-chain fatty acid--CoA ligase [Flavobacteriaceae bacterium]